MGVNSVDKQPAKLCGRGLGDLGYLLDLFLHCLMFMLDIKLQGLFAELGDGMQIQEEKKNKGKPKECFIVSLIFFP